MDCFNKFKPKEVLCSNPSQKRVVLLGQIEGQTGQAIYIVNSKMPNLSENTTFTKINKIFVNDIYGRFDVFMEGEYEIQTIFPVNEKHKNKYSQKKMIATKEKAEDYQKLKDQLLKYQLNHIDWVFNILEGKAESERVLFRNAEFVILPDFKFSNLSETYNLHLLVIFTNKQLHSIRDLNGSHLETLKSLEINIDKVLSEKFNLQEGSCRMFFHYPPTFYQLHTHVTHLRSMSSNSLVERSHLLQNVIANLQMDSDYYSKVTLIKCQQSKI